MILRHVINRYVIWNKKNANQITEIFVKTSGAKSNHVSCRESPLMGLFIESTIYYYGVFELNIKFLIRLVRYNRKFFDRSVDAQWELLFFDDKKMVFQKPVMNVLKYQLFTRQ